MFDVDQYDLPDTPFSAEIEDAGENEWIWTIWATDPENDDALVEVDRGSSTSKTEARLEVESAAQSAMASWGFNG